MKANKRQVGASLPLVPAPILIPLWCVALALPNLVYSGVRFADTLHIIKWAVAGAPVAIALAVAGLRLLWYERRLALRLDIFGALWALLLVYCAAQPLWTDIFSPTGMTLELTCFAAVWAFYVLSLNSFPGWGLRLILWLANVNAAINVLFAELQIRNMNNLAFLKGTLLEFLTPLSSVILPTPGNYIGNTAQQNMFGLWMAVCVMGSVYLFIAYATGEDGRKRPPALTLLNLLLMGVNIWGLWNSTSRSAILSLFVGLFVLGALLAVRFGRAYAKRLGMVLLLFAAVLLGAMLVTPQRSGDLIAKTMDMIQNAGTVGGRDGIWETSAAMFKEHPMGVGVGQFKWHYLEAQREVYKTNSGHRWQYTHWAHNEFLQWFCESGVIGGALLLLMYGVWISGLARGLWRASRRREGTERRISPDAIWGCALVALISFNALWTRPFHRIENILWLALAFALANREFLSEAREWRPDFSGMLCGGLGLVCLGASFAGTAYLVSGIQGNLLLRQALSTTNAPLQLYLLERANEHPIVREEAQKNLGHHYLQVGDQTNDLKTMGKGFNILWQHFLREPHSEEIGRLLNWAQRFQIEEAIRELVSYLRPDTYRLERRPGTDSRGNKVNALVVVGGPAPK